jgi:uncharacterized protein
MNRVVHFEIHAKDLDKMQKFYSDIFGWKISDMGPKMGNYRIVNTGKDTKNELWPGINGGITPRQGESPKKDNPVNAYVCTIDVKNIDEYLEKILKSGGTMAIEKMDVPGVGWLAYCKDIEGNVFGVMQPQKKTR